MGEGGVRAGALVINIDTPPQRADTPPQVFNETGREVDKPAGMSENEETDPNESLKSLPPPPQPWTGNSY